jgi:hypothetical protein
LIVAAAAAVLGVAAIRAHAAATASCVPRFATSTYTASISHAVASGSDVLGNRLLQQPGGPTYAAAKRLLTPLSRALQWNARPLTASGSYYLPFSFDFTPNGDAVFALHVADGSQIVTRHVGGPSLTIDVGAAGKERYGSCASRLAPAKLAEGWLPILQTAYTDSGGVRYQQESFAGRAYGKYGARSVISFVRLTVDATQATHGATVRLVPWKRLAHTAPDRLADAGQTRLIVSTGAQFVDGVARYRIPPGARTTIYAEWLNAPSDAQYVHATAKTYDVARATVIKFWDAQLAQGATIQVPDPTVQNALQGIVTQLVAYGWRYSIGNPYEELSYEESLDAAEVAAELGYSAVAKSIVNFALERMRVRPIRFNAFRGAHILYSAATYYRLTDDKGFLRAATPELEVLVQRIASRREKSGLLAPEALSTDLENHFVHSVSGEIEAIEGLYAIARAWGPTADGKRARSLAQTLDRGLAPKLKRASTNLKDGSLFVPDQLPQKPFKQLTATRDGSYWNLVMPEAFGSGWFAPGTATSRGIMRYLLQHGSRFLGVPRTSAQTVYGRETGAGLAQVYGLGISRFLADNDQPDQLDLTLYGMLAAGMTANTYVSGEAVSVLPVHSAYERSMFMPPNTGANASFLGTLRELLVHERRGAQGAPAGLDLAFSTPRAWLEDGKQIVVQDAPTSFGKVSFTLARSGSTIDGSLVVPAGSHARLRLRVPAGERVTRVVVGSASLPVDSAGTVDLGSEHGSLSLSATVSR